MRAEPAPESLEERQRTSWIWYVVTALAAVVGVALLVDSLRQSSATYDEPTYLRVAAEWWRGRSGPDQGEQAITRMGSPLTFWKLQQAPMLWALDRAGLGSVIDNPNANQPVLLTLARLCSLWIWLVGLVLTAAWSRCLYGPRAMAFAAWLYALSPNLLAHGALVTMELPLLACTTAMFFAFWAFLRSGKRHWFILSAMIGGLAFSCKFTTVLIPPILALAWWLATWRAGERRPIRLMLRVVGGMIVYGAILLAANVVVTGCAVMPLAHNPGAHPSVDGRVGPALGRLVTIALETSIPQDWVGFATQTLHQRTGGPSYLFGQTRMTGWWYYYFVALAVKVPIAFWVLVAARAFCLPLSDRSLKDWLLPLANGVFLIATAIGSSRNYGVRYLLPLAPLAIVWVSALAQANRRAVAVVCAGLVGQAVAVASIHPYELSYFNILAGGAMGGRHILSDSNLDWGQGLVPLARLQQQEPKYRDLTLYYFGDTDPKLYGVAGRCYVVDAQVEHPGLPLELEAETEFIAVSASLQWGPWGPRDYFKPLDRLAPVRMTADQTIAIYRWRP